MHISWEAENQVPADHAIFAENNRIKGIDARSREIAPRDSERHQWKLTKPYRLDNKPCEGWQAEPYDLRREPSQGFVHCKRRMHG
jgi:hypothetical protein